METSLNDKLLLLCARRRLDPEQVHSLQELAEQNPDWEQLLQTAQQHGLLPLLYQHLKALPSETVPQIYLDQLHALSQQNARRNLLLTGELLRILEQLETGGIPAIPFKGPALAASVYGDISLRQFADLDLLVRKPDATKAKDFLLCHGYRPYKRLTSAQWAAALRSQCHYQLVKTDADIVVELHWEFNPNRLSVPMNTEGLWKRVDWVPLGGVRVRSLSDEDLLLYLCVHGSKHLWERLEWLCDAAEMIRVRPKIDWGELAARAKAAGARRMLFLGLFLAKDLLNANLPEEIWQKVSADPAVKALAVQIEKRLSLGTIGLFGFFETLPFYFQMRERTRDKVWDTMHHGLSVMIPTAKEWDSWPLPDFLFPLYYAVRPIRLMSKYGRKLLS